MGEQIAWLMEARGREPFGSRLTYDGPSVLGRRPGRLRRYLWIVAAGAVAGLGLSQIGGAGLRGSDTRSNEFTAEWRPAEGEEVVILPNGQPLKIADDAPALAAYHRLTSGAARGEPLVVEGRFFDPGSATVSALGHYDLAELGSVLAAFPLVPVRIACDRVSEEVVERRGITDQRCTAVAQLLREQGVEPKRLRITDASEAPGSAARDLRIVLRNR